MTQNPEKEWFGEKRVTPGEKTGLVRGVFDSVAVRYDLMNDLMSGGLHRLWKDSFVRRIRPRPGLSYLDVAGGTGDIAFRLRRKAGPDTKIAVCDLNAQMLDVGRARAEDKGWLNGFEWVCGNAEALPFPDSSFDVYTIAFGLRNVTHIDTALAEARRVLRPGGRFYCLEFSRVQEPLLAKLYDAYSFNVIPKMGRLAAGDEESYRYLVESIRKFPDQKALVRRMTHAGLKNTGFENFSAGIVAVHTGLRL
jgi:demethylmenaquinone methyltransferase / 2-methoxy-6-polyprenyl-1,4-benzoquinol methylase